MARRSRKMFEPGFDPASYNLQALHSKSMAELQHEYARIREEARDRLRGFARSKVWSERSKIYRENKDRFPALREIKNNRRALEHLTIEGLRFVTSKGSSISGAKEIQRDVIDSLREAGWDWVNTSNIWDVTEFLEWARNQALDRSYGSGSVLDVYGWARDNQVSSEDLKTAFERFVQGEKTTSLEDIKSALLSWRRKATEDPGLRFADHLDEYLAGKS